MSIFEWEGVRKEREDYLENGTIAAVDEVSAKSKLMQRGYKDVRLRKLSGFRAFLKQFFVQN